MKGLVMGMGPIAYASGSRRAFKLPAGMGKPWGAGVPITDTSSKLCRGALGRGWRARRVGDCASRSLIPRTEGISSMNLHPKVRPLWQRVLALPILTLLMVYKALHLPTFFLPRDIRNIIKHWDFRVYWVLISSGLNRAYIDQPCEFTVPADCTPKVVVDPKWRLTEAQIRKFYEDGFIGP